MHFGIGDDTPCDPISNWRYDSRVGSVKWITGHGVVNFQTLHGKYATGRQSRSAMLRVCTWNVRGLDIGKLQTFENRIGGLAITGVAETH